jgi:16S rRNA (cytosine967-C5)-methyltransferase
MADHPISDAVSLEKLLKFVAKLCLKGEPLPVAFEKARELGLLRGLNGDEAYETARRFLLYYNSLEGNLDERIERFLRGEGRPSFPPWAEEALPRLRAEAESSLRRTYWFWVNPLKGDPDKTEREVLSEIEAERDRDFPELFRAIKGNPTKLRAFKEGRIVVQDKASFAVVKALDPRPRELIYDMASAPGVKVALVMALTGNSAEVVASELEGRRLEKERKLLRELGVNLDRIHLVNADSSFPLVRRADKVLLDAPCSSSGMVPNDPSVLLTLTREKVERFSRLQRDMLRTALTISKRIVFSTCSVFPQEGEEQVRGMRTAQLNFGERTEGGVRFWPSMGTQGFFMSVILNE